MSASANDQEFRAAVESLETCLMIPRVPGELERWIEAAEDATEFVGAVLARQIDQEHRDCFKQITSDDPELHARVKQLKIGDEHCLERHQILWDRVRSLKQEVPQVEPDEGRLEPALVEFCDMGLSLVLELRKQEVAIATWFQEAFSRDRGTGD